MTGSIRCNSCRKKMDGVCQCGNYKCLVQVYWKGKYYEYRRDDQGYVFTYEKALDRLVEINNRMKKGTFKPEDFTDSKIDERRFDNMINKWLEEKERREMSGELSCGTLKDYKGYVKNYYHVLYEHDVREIALEHLSDLKDALSKVRIKTRQNIMNALRNFFHWLRERGVINSIPIFPKITGDDSVMRKAIDYESQKEILLKIPEKHRDVFEFLMETGLRPGEACAIVCGNINVKEGFASIERTFSGGKLRETTKQKKKRIIPLSDKAYEIAVRNLKNKVPMQFMFINPNTNKNYLSDTLWKIWRQYSGASVCLYEATRHSFGTQLIEQADVSVVKELMGHSSIKTTEKYLHMKVEKLKDVVNARGKIRMVNRSGLEVSFAND